MAVLICLTAHGVLAAAPGPEKADQPRVDIIHIDGLKAFGKLERPPVIYFHQKHTEALAQDNKDCSACHLAEKKRLSFKFMRLSDTGKQAAMDIYHDNCIGCHRETAAADRKSGPVACAQCHQDKPAESARVPIGMDNSLHYRHVRAHEDKCERCHHEYDQTAKKLVYVKDKEGTCRYCHLDTRFENRISMRNAAHLDCVNCHQRQLALNQSAGPVSCSGCHDAEQQKLIETLADVPRLKRRQPDVTLIRAQPSEGVQLVRADRFNAVPFDHKAHEAANSTCRVCHHADLNACGSCHTAGGDPKGNFVNLQDSMHRIKAQASCVGCHANRQADAACAGCHKAMALKSVQDPTTCLSCHTELPADTDLSTDDHSLATMLLAARDPKRETYRQEDIPEVVEIGVLTQQYDRVKLPHRRIVNKLVKNIAGNALAAYFHPEPGTLCQGCHHNSPAGKKPPKCASCHGRPFDEKDPLKPGLMAAYHMQCMNCHADMGIEQPVSTNCTACHRAKTR